MTFETQHLYAPDGHRIHLHHWPRENPKLVVQLCHGMAEHCARYDGLAAFLAEHNIAMAGADHRGFGQSVEHHGARGHYADDDGWHKVVEDQFYVYTRIHQLYPATPVVLLGHSMGSYIAQQFAMDHGNKLAGLILSGSNMQSRPLLYFGLASSYLERLRLGGHTKSDLLDKLSFGAFNKAFEPARTEFDWLSRDPAEVDKYIEDPLCGDMSSTQLWIDLLHGLLQLYTPEAMAQIPHELPIYIFGGSDDPAGGKKGLHKLYNLYRSSGHDLTSLRVYPSGRHEMLNETNREEVYRDMLDWLVENIPNKK